MPKISVIVPVYNVEPYLRKCVDSILNQNFTDFELLLIDDGSTDCSGMICDEYANRDSRVKVFHTANRGVSAARNLGIGKASAEWITFVDSDDWVEKEYLFEFIKNLPAKNGIVYQSFFVDFVDIPKKNRIDPSYANVLLISPFVEEEIVHYNVLDNRFVTAKLFNRRVVRDYNIRFHEDISICEDAIFVRTYLLYVSEMRLSALSAYHYMQRGRSTLSAQSHSSEECILAFERLWKSLSLLLNTFSIRDERYLRKVYTFGALARLINAFQNVNIHNYAFVFEYVRAKKYLFVKYYIHRGLRLFLFVYVLFNRLFPKRLLYLIVCFRRHLKLFR